jgi:putative toxin-antitoxin system antitoxin component (TIGR02293 family)
MKIRVRKRRLASRMCSAERLINLAQHVLGTREDAVAWFCTRAVGLNSCRPIDVGATQKGARLVRSLLRKMEYGVYT